MIFLKFNNVWIMVFKKMTSFLPGDDIFLQLFTPAKCRIPLAGQLQFG
jgi:hypothetical protein